MHLGLLRFSRIVSRKLHQKIFETVIERTVFYWGNNMRRSHQVMMENIFSYTDMVWDTGFTFGTKTSKMK